MRILVIGDFHIPDREKEIPSQIFNDIKNSKFDLILCTGDLTDLKIFNQLKSMAPVKIVVGNMDFYFGIRTFPRFEVFTIGHYSYGLVHGTGIHPRGNPEGLAKIANELNVDILISGHTHAQSVNFYKNILLINPGSATGSWGGGPSTGIPSFQILEDTSDELEIINVRLKSGKLFREIERINLKSKEMQ